MKPLWLGKNRREQRAAPRLALFPFLAVLICTMGALVLVLLAVTRQARLQAVHSARAEAVEKTVDASAERSAAAWRVEQLRKSRQETESQLADARLVLGHVEDHTRRLAGRLQQLTASAKDLDCLKGEKVRYASVKQEEIAAVETQIAAVQKGLDEIRRTADQRPRSYAVVPYDGPNQTRRHPIYLECREDGVVLRPENLGFGEADFDGPLGPGNPLAAALRGAAREYLAIQGGGSGGDGEPYPLLLVRPSGIAAYGAARAAMKSWGPEFGYELIGEDWKVDFPPPDPGLAKAVGEAVSIARADQARLIAAAPSRYGKRPRSGSYRAEAGGPGGDDERSAEGNGSGSTPRGPPAATAATSPQARLPVARAPAAPAAVAFPMEPPAAGGGRGTGDGLYAGGPAVGGGTAGGGLPYGNGPSLGGVAGGGLSGLGGATASGAAGQMQTGGPAVGIETAGSGGGGLPYGNGPSLGGVAGGGVSGPGGATAGGAAGQMQTGGPVVGSGSAGSGGSGLPYGSGPSPGGVPGGGVSGPGGAMANGAAGQGSSAGTAASPDNRPQSRADGPDANSGPLLTRPDGGYVAGQPMDGPPPPAPRDRPVGGQATPAPRPGEWRPSDDYAPPKKHDEDEDDKTARKGHKRRVERRGEDWALPDATKGAAALARPIRVDCYPDRLVVLPEDAGGKTIPWAASPARSVERLVAVVWERMDSWGIAGKGMYWRPILRVNVAPGAERQFEEFASQLRGSGLSVERQGQGIRD